MICLNEIDCDAQTITNCCQKTICENCILILLKTNKHATCPNCRTKLNDVNKKDQDEETLDCDDTIERAFQKMINFF